MLNPSLLAFLGQQPPTGGAMPMGPGQASSGPMPMTPIQTPRVTPMTPVPGLGPIPAPRMMGVTPPRQPSRMTRFLNAILPPPDPSTAALLGEDGVRGAQRQALLTLGASLLSNSGWTDRPVPLSQALGQGVLAAQQGYQQQIGTGVQNVIAAEQARALADQRAAVGEANRALAEERQFELAEVKRLAAGRPGFYGEFMRGFDQLPPDQQKARLVAMNNKALTEGDTVTAQRLTALLASGNLFATPKGSELEVKQNIAGRDVAINPITGEIVKDYGPSRRMAGGGSGDGDSIPGVPGAIGRYVGGLGKLNTFIARAAPVIALANKPDSELTGLNSVQALFSFIQGLDDTAVRDGERALVNSADPLVRRIQEVLSGAKYVYGRQMSPGTIREIAKIIRENVRQRQSAFESTFGGDRGLIEAGAPAYPIDRARIMPVPDIITNPSPAASPAGTPPANLPPSAASARSRLGGTP